MVRKPILFEPDRKFFAASSCKMHIGSFKAFHVKSVSSAGKDRPWPWLYTVPYAAPELLQHVNSTYLVPNDFHFKAQDMWSLGCLLAKMLINYHPFLWPTGTMFTKAEMEISMEDHMQSGHAKWVGNQ